MSSPLRRAQQTAAATADVLGLEVVTHLDLDEIRFTADTNKEVFARTSAPHIEPDVDDYASTAMAAVHAVPRFVWVGNGRGRTATSCAGAPTSPSRGRRPAWRRRRRGLHARRFHLGRHRRLARHRPRHVAGAVAHQRGHGLVTPDDKIVIGVNDASHLYPDEDPLGIVTRAIGARL